MLFQTNRRCSPRSVSVRGTVVPGREKDAWVWLAGFRPNPLLQVTVGLRPWLCGEGAGEPSTTPSLTFATNTHTPHPGRGRAWVWHAGDPPILTLSSQSVPVCALK